jgi:hypothetical protein
MDAAQALVSLGLKNIGAQMRSSIDRMCVLIAALATLTGYTVVALDDCWRVFSCLLV